MLHYVAHIHDAFFRVFVTEFWLPANSTHHAGSKVPRMPPASRYHLVPQFDPRNPTKSDEKPIGGIACIRQKTCLGFHYVFDVFLMCFWCVFDVFFLWSCEISVSTIRLVISVEHNGSKMGHCWPSKLLNLVQFSYKTWWQNHFESSYSGPVVPKEMPKKGPGVVNVRWWPSSRISANISRSEKLFLSFPIYFGLAMLWCPVSL